MRSKIFCVSFHKTGTTSFKDAVRHLGYSVTGPDGHRDPDIAENAERLVHAQAEKFDAFQDNPWPFFYRQMDEKYPGSKFVFLDRDPNDWIKSQVRHFGTHETPMRRWIYGVGCPAGNEDIYLRRYNEHRLEVKRYFATRPRDFLVMDFARGDGWERLCGFLGHPVPAIPFPHSNREQTTAALPKTGLIDKAVRSILKLKQRRMS